MDPLFKAHFDVLPREIRNLVLAYLGNCIDRAQHSLEDLVNLASSNPQEKEEIMTTIAQAIRQEGMQQGMQVKSVEIAKNMLHSNESKEKIQQFTGLSWVEIEALIREQESVKQ
jgi:predicted transposase/invertase (TIGR01784 family)